MLLVRVMSFTEIFAFELQFPPENFIETLKLMEHRYGAKDFVTSRDIGLLSPNTYYLTEVDSLYRRFYARKSDDIPFNTTHVSIVVNDNWCVL